MPHCPKGANLLDYRHAAVDKDSSHMSIYWAFCPPNHPLKSVTLDGIFLVSMYKKSISITLTLWLSNYILFNCLQQKSFYIVDVPPWGQLATQIPHTWPWNCEYLFVFHMSHLWTSIKDSLGTPSLQILPTIALDGHAAPIWAYIYNCSQPAILSVTTVYLAGLYLGLLINDPK